MLYEVITLRRSAESSTGMAEETGEREGEDGFEEIEIDLPERAPVSAPPEEPEAGISAEAERGLSYNFV